MQLNTINSLLLKYGKDAKHFAPVQSFKQASDFVQIYTGKNDLGASEWIGDDTGNIYNVSGELVARVSYNGRVWDKEGKEITGAVLITPYYA